MFLDRIYNLAFALFLIRLVSFIFTLPSNFDNLWHPGSFSSFPSFIYWILAFIAIIAVYIFTKKISKTSEKIQNSFFIFFGISFLTLSLFNKSIPDDDTNYSYLFLYESYSNFSKYISDIFPNLILDLFFDVPYIAWSLGFMAIVYIICKKYKHIEYAIPFWIIPFSFIKFRSSDLFCAALLSYLVIAIIGMLYSKKKNSFPVYIVQFFIYLVCVIYSYKILGIEYIPFKVAIETLLIFYIPSLFVYWICNKDKTDNSVALTWILPVFTIFLLNLPLYRLQTGDCLIFLIYMLNCFYYYGNIVLAILIVSLIAFIFEKIIKKSGKFVFSLCSLGVILFYILDAFLYYYSQFRINYQTLAWTATMNDIGRKTLITCFDYLSAKSIALLLFIIFVSIFIIFKNKKIIKENSNFNYIFIVILLVSHISIALIPLSSPIPQLHKEPFFELIKSFPVEKYFQERLSMKEIEEGFKKCDLPLINIPEKNINNNLDQQTNIILISLESVHWRYVNIFGKEPRTWPMLSKFKNRMEIFPFIFSCYPESTCGDFAMVDSLVPYSHLYLNKKINVIHKGLINELKKLDYNTYLFTSGSIYDGGFNNLAKTLPFDNISTFIASEVKNTDDAWIWGYKEEYTANKIIDFLNSRKTQNNFFLWYRMAYPHAPFELFGNKKFEFQEKNEYEVMDLVSRYKNGLVYVDSVLSEFINKITEFDKKNNQRTLIVMVGDHGEMLGEKDNLELKGHGLFTTPQIQNVVCIMIKPEEEGLKINKNVGSQIDITPTILDCLNIEPSVERYSQGVSLYSDNIASRPVFLSSMRSYALVENGYFFEFRDKNSPNFKVTKLTFSEEDYKPHYETLSNWHSHKEIFEKYQKAKLFFRLQEDFLNRLE